MNASHFKKTTASPKPSPAANTLGLLLSVDGFQPDGVEAHSKQRPVLLLMTGSDLMSVLEGRIDFVDLLVRKRRHASQTGKVLTEFSQM
jgi:hypothetical protein